MSFSRQIRDALYEAKGWMTGIEIRRAIQRNPSAGRFICGEVSVACCQMAAAGILERVPWIDRRGLRGSSFRLLCQPDLSDLAAKRFRRREPPATLDL